MDPHVIVLDFIQCVKGSDTQFSDSSGGSVMLGGGRSYSQNVGQISPSLSVPPHWRIK